MVKALLGPPTGGLGNPAGPDRSMLGWKRVEMDISHSAA